MVAGTFRTCLLLISTMAITVAADPVQTPGSNVTVTSCHAQLDPPPVRIIYTNTAPQTAIEVDFEVAGPAGTIRTVQDRGQFATGRPINHTFALPPETSPLGLSSAKCIVTRVVYADGSSWTNPKYKE